MSTNDMKTGDEQLLWQLRGLRRERMPDNDLWPGIAARIQQAGREAAPGNAVPMRRRLKPARVAPWALAASLVLAIGVSWQQRPDYFASPGAGPSAQLIHREADALTREYNAALRELQGAGRPASGSRDVLRQLDQSAAQIRTALARDPGARFLLDRLRSTYEKRLDLTQRATFT